MTRDNASLRQLTRAVLLGTSIAAVPLTLAGCAADHGYGSPDDYAAAAPSDDPKALSARERQLCAEALSSGDPQTVERLLRTYPQSRCIPDVLAALPPETLAAIPSGALAGVPASTREAIPAQTMAHLRFPRTAAPAPAPEPAPAPQRARELEEGY